MYRMIDPTAARSVANSLAEAATTIAALTSSLRPLIPEKGHLQLVGRSIAWWEETASDIQRRVAALEPAPGPDTGPEWTQGPPQLDDVDSPTKAAAFFAALSPHQATELTRRFPDHVGPLDGAPIALRYAANHLLAVRHLEDLRRRRRMLAATTNAGFDFAGGHLGDRLRSPFADRRRSGFRERAYLDGRIADAERWANGQRRFLRFDPVGDGQIIEVLGELESSHHVAVVIPGLGNEFTNYEQGFHHTTTSLYLDANRSDAAVVAWLGYDSPDDLLEATDRHPIEAAGSLSKFLAGLDVSLDHRAHTTVIGHSYGSLVAGQAIGAGARVDEVVFIGSPGVGVDHVSELGLPPSTRVWAGRAPSDPIQLAKDLECLDLIPVCYPAADRLFFGFDPTDPSFGATQFAVGDAPIREAHSSYFRQGSQSLRNLTYIFLGQDHRVVLPGS